MVALQIGVNTAITAGLVAVVGQSFGALSRCAGTFNLAVGASVTLGGYLFLAIIRSGAGFELALLGTTVACVLLGCLVELLVQRPLRRTGGGELPMLLGSLAIYLIVENSVSAIWGQRILSFRSGVSERVQFVGVSVTLRQILLLISCLLVYVSVELWLRRTTVGKKVRAVGDNRGLASLVGIDADRVSLIVAGVGFGTAGVAGILIGWEVDLRPQMGFYWLLSGTVAMVVGGSSRATGVLGAALGVSLVQNLVAYVAGSEWASPATYLLLILFLWWRPNRHADRSLLGTP